MTAADLRAALAKIPDADPPPPPPELARLIDEDVAYLASDAARASLRADPYWPKWSSPWWRMLTLYELGAADRIPPSIARAMVVALDALPLHVFPIREEEWPPGADRARDAECHCALGAIDQVLDACGVDVDRELPWIAAWYPRYQMADGGYNCDERAYLVTGECPSSMVATVAVLEALIRRGPSETCDRAAALLIARELRLGSPTAHNAAERDAARSWGALCSPRFYFYDVLRGLAALVRWAAAHGRTLPLAAVAPVAQQLAAAFPDGIARVGRRPHADLSSWWPGEAGGPWVRRPSLATPLTEHLATIGAPSAALTRQWREARRTLIALLDADRVR